MKRFLLLIAFCPTLAAAVSNDYYECRSPDGSVFHSVDRCPSGRRIADRTPPENRALGESRSKVTQIVSAGAHFRGMGEVNGLKLPMMVDTGATFVSMSMDDARRAGVNLQNAKSGKMSTANGIVSALIANADSVTFSGHTVRNVPVAVQVSGSPASGVLLGMSFLRHFEMNINGGVLSLHRK